MKNGATYLFLRLQRFTADPWYMLGERSHNVEHAHTRQIKRLNTAPILWVADRKSCPPTANQEVMGSILIPTGYRV